MVPAPYQEAIPILDVDYRAAMEAAVELGIAHAVLVEVGQQVVVRELDLGDLHGLPALLGPRRNLLLTARFDLGLHLCVSASHNVSAPNCEKYNKTKSPAYQEWLSLFTRLSFRESRPRAEVHSPLPEREAQKDPQAR